MTLDAETALVGISTFRLLPNACCLGFCALRAVPVSFTLNLYMKTSMKRLPHGLSVGIGIAAGTLLYTGFLSSTQEFDWYRALFVGTFLRSCRGSLAA